MSNTTTLHNTDAVARTIYNQIGRLAMRMMGAYDVYGNDDSLQFKIKGSKAFKHIKVTLNVLDLYTVTFTQWKGNGTKGTTVVTVENIYADQLLAVFTDKTGLYTTL